MLGAPGLAPIFDSNARVLVLGSMPGRESLRQQQYYAHPRNAFWSIIESRFKGGDSVGQLASSNADYRVRVQALLELKLAVWDVLANCERPGSLDSSIVRGSETYNPLPELVGKPPDLRAILFNGQKAHTLFERNFRAYREQSSLDFKTMPSTSPAYAAMPKTEKIDYWNAVLDPYLHSHN